MTHHFLRCTNRIMPPPPVLLIIVFVILVFFPCGTSPALTSSAGGEEDEINQVVELRFGTDDLVKWGGYGEEKLSVVTITGGVVCGGDRPCYVFPEDQTAQLSSSIPVSGATVAIFCGTKESRKSWVRAITDEYGDFSVELPSHLHAIPNLEKVCFANLLHLPKNSLCSRQQITRKQMINGIKLLSVEDGVRAYVADTMHLEPRSAKACKFTGAV